MSASIPLFIPEFLKRYLRDNGFSDGDIADMKPEEAWQQVPERLAAAWRYAARGWYPFPCRPMGKAPLTPHGFKDATTDPEQIRAWWTRWPEANVALATGASGLVVPDADVKNHAPGLENWRELRATMHLDDHTPTVETPSGGLHIYYLANGHHVSCSTGKLAEGIDVRAEGGYVVAPPSTTPDGDYGWALGCPDDPIPLPDALLELLADPSQSADVWQAATHAKGGADPLPDEIPRGARNATLASAAGTLQRRGFTRDAILAALLAENASRCHPPLTESEVAGIVDSISQYPPEEQVPLLQQPTVTDYLLDEEAGDLGNANCVCKLSSDQFLRTPSHGWLFYNGQFWDETLGEERLGQTIIDTLRQRRVAAVQENREDIVRAAKPSATHKNAAKNLLHDMLAVNITGFDADPNLLNCQNGVLDLQTGDLVTHDRSQLFTYCLPVEYDLEADHSEWTALLLEWTGERAIVDYLQMAVGYSLTGHTREECLFYLYGPTRSGKGTFTETILAMLGKEPIGTEVDFTTFTASRSNDSQNFDLAPLKPCRFVVTGEGEKRVWLSEARIKALTGGNDVRCAFKYKTHFTYRPQFKLWLVSNWPVQGDVEDDAFWTRVKAISFPNSYAGLEDKLLKARLKRRENLEAVLAWAVKGAIRWYNRGSQGLTTPPQVQALSDRHRAELDYVGQWLEECATITDNPNDFASNSSLYLSYSNWCHENGAQAKGRRSLGRVLTKKGLVGDKRWIHSAQKQRRGYKGIKLEPNDQADQSSLPF